MVQALDDWEDDYGNQDEWDEWEDDAPDVTGFGEPELERQGSSFNNALEIYSTKQRTDVKFLNEDEIRPVLEQRVATIEDELGLSNDLARALLLKNEWNPRQAVRNFSDDPDYIQRTFGFDIGAIDLPAGGADILCPVCFCDYPLNEFVHLRDCGHGLCTYCFEGYLTSKLGDGKGVEQTVCPEQKCNMIVPERIFVMLLTPDLVNRYRSFLMKSFVELSTKAKWCPGRDCTMAVESSTGAPVDVKCSRCDMAFCFGCTKNAHMPIDCEGLSTWDDRINNNEDDSNNWMKINTKPCPKCKSPIEKNQGCMHMTCSQCRYEFCWLCMGDYRNHSAETGKGLCNSFEDVKKLGRETQQMTDAAKIERELKRFEHYSMRYIEHQKSIAHAQRALSLIKLQVAQALELNTLYGPKDFQFLIEIAELVVAARRSLSFTYAIRFFLKGPNKQAFFDFIQGDLENSLEALNKKNEENWLDYVDYDYQGKLQLGERFFKYKQMVTTLRSAVENHFNNVMREISDGLPSVSDDYMDDSDHTFDGSSATGKWTCRTCQVKNDMARINCITCQSARPDFSFQAGNRAQGKVQIGKKR